MRVLVTGGAGFIGSHVVDELVHAGHDVVVVDAAIPQAHRTRPDVRADVEHRWLDIRDERVAADAVRDVDAVCHQASMVGLGSDFDDVVDYVSHNDGGTASLLRALHARRFAGPLVLASSMVVYGEGHYTCAEHGAVDAPPRPEAQLAAGRFEPECPSCGRPLDPAAIAETARLDPRNVYAATKLHQEHLVTAFARVTGSRAVALRYHNVYGPRMPSDTPYAGVASLFRSALARGERPQVYEDGAQLRDFVHVRDVARANRLALESSTFAGPANIASGRPRSVGDLARALCDAAGAPPPVVTGAYRLGDVRHVFASPARAREELGFTAEVPFAAGLAEFATAALRT